MPGIDLLRTSAGENKLVAVIGTGVSIALTDNKIPALAWRGLIKDGFAHAVRKGKITVDQEQHWQSQIASNDLDDLLLAADFMSRKLGGPKSDLYARWFETAVGGAQPTNKKMVRAIETLRAAGIPLCTLNYDQLLERVTSLPALTLENPRHVTAFMRGTMDAILHLHGTYESPATCILSARDYETTLDNEVRNLLQRALASFNRLLFIGCNGTFADPNYSALITWLRKNLGAATLQHYALVTDGEVTSSNADPAWEGFVDPISYGSTHADLPIFLHNTFRVAIKPAGEKKPVSVTALSAAGVHSKLLVSYRKFLLRDCGEMTIEGMPADMNTGQRRFDLERLFVPLQVQDCLPEPRGTLARRGFSYAEPCDFSKAFADNQALALLALPGGGKTLLLKRLVVAYADPARRQRSTDALPSLDLTPVLIRCREWREHLHRPILTLLDSLPAITGQPDLVGLREALLPLFKSGRILLLVDGLDEIHDGVIRSTFVEHLEVFMRDYSSTRLVVTSREAGFSLVAPRLASFCSQYRITPLNNDAILALCRHWHRLMVADSADAEAEGTELALQILRKDSLRRLAENPLLLTMLLVVKHGAGGLPPDRVSLYGRAVEILLNTWNTKGHEPLSPKEAVPQLAYIAYQMLCTGKQTATEEELLVLIEEARIKVPRIRFYASDTPHEFLTRVETRSSLLIEIGHQADEKGRIVPFYQFRHLTFQEYLTAVAVADGHYPEASSNDTILAPLERHFIDPTWKEVIPMTAVLAKKAAEPLMAALVERGIILRRQFEDEIQSKKQKNLLDDLTVPAPVDRLVECLIEEAEAAPKTLSAAFQIAAFFAQACIPSSDWPALSRGPYGAAFLHQAWTLYAPMKWPGEILLGGTLTRMAAWRQPLTYWHSNEGLGELQRWLRSLDSEDVVRGLFTCAGLLGDWGREVWRDSRRDSRGRNTASILLPDVEPHLFNDNPAIWGAAASAWASIQRRRPMPLAIPHRVLDRLVALWLNRTCGTASLSAARSLTSFHFPRGVWKPVLTDEQRQRVAAEGQGGPASEAACIFILFHAQDIVSDAHLILRAARRLTHAPYSRDRGLQWILRYLKHAAARRVPRGTKDTIG